MLSRREWIVAGACLLSLWAVAAGGLAPRLRDRLHLAAKGLQEQLDAQSGGERFNRVSLVFEGQTVRVHGSVRSQHDANRLLTSLQADLRTPGNHWNPVRQVVTEGSLAVHPLEPGWLLAALRGYEAEIIGVCASAAERAALEESLRRRWPTWRGTIQFGLQVDPRRFDEASAWLRSVQQFPAPEARGRQSARLLAARLGGPWQELTLEDRETMPPELRALGLSGSEWSERVRPRLEAVHRHLLAETAWEKEQERLRRLPPAHVFMGRRGDQVLLRGEVFDVEAKRALFSAIMTALPGSRILDDLRATGARRPAAGPGVPAADLLQGGADGKVFVLGVPGRDWTALELTGDSPTWKDALPPGLDSSPLAADHAVVLDWLQGSNAGIPALPTPLRPAFVTLAAYAGRVVIGGQLAEEAHRAQLLEAVKRAYPSGWSVRDEIAVSGACTPSPTLQHTLQSVPANAVAPSLLAVALPGQPWRVLPPGRVSDAASLTADLLPEGLPASLVGAALQNSLEEMRALGFDLAPGTSNVTTPNNDPE